jgi:hypothetical protein
MKVFFSFLTVLMTLNGCLSTEVLLKLIKMEQALKCRLSNR